MKIKGHIKILVATLLFACSSYGQSIINKDSLLYNTKKSRSDRLLFYDRDNFIWIRQDTMLQEKYLELSFGQFKTIGDTIYFTYPDSTRKPNKYYCFCKYKGHEFTGFQLYNIPETWPPGSIDRVYRDLFKKRTPELAQVTTLVQFKAIRQKNKIIFIDHKDENNEYVFSKR